MNYVTLNNGVKMPIIGFGVFQITDLKECEKAVLDAIDSGYRLIDTAQSYSNEEAVGNALKKTLVPRKELFITTKIWISNANYEKTKESIKTSLKKLQLDYLDLVLIHQPLNDYYSSYKALEDLYKEGKIKAIGVSNFSPDRLVDLTLFNEITPAINQVETNIFKQQIKANEIMKKYSIQHEAWAPFAEGRNDMFNNPTLKEIGNKYNKSIAQVILRWLIQRDIIVLAKSIKKERMEENINIFDFKLSLDEMSLISKMDKNESSFFEHSSPEAIEYLANLVDKRNI